MRLIKRIGELRNELEMVNRIIAALERVEYLQRTWADEGL
jgi:hypothetical protein